MRRVVSLWLPFWPTDRLRRRRFAALPADAPLVTRAHDGRRLVVAAACAAARRGGLHAGMPLAQAQAVLPGLVIVEADAAGDAAALVQLAAWCSRLSPATAADPPDGVWIDLSGCAHLRGGEEATLEALRGALERDGVAARLAIADTPGAAHALARHAARPVLVAAPRTDAALLAPLPVVALRLPAEIAAGLRRLGLDRIGVLAAAPRGPLARRFGADTLLRLDQALGRVFEPIAPVIPRDAARARLVFAEPLGTAEAFEAVLPLLAAELCAELERRGEGARRLDLVFERVDALVPSLRISLAQPSRDPAHLVRLLGERLEDVDPGLGVDAMVLVAVLAEALERNQRGGGLDGEADRIDLSPLVDRLVNRLGPGGVFRSRPVDSDVPERAETAAPFPLAAIAATPVPAAVGTGTWPRPVRLLPAPEPVAALELLPDHPPRAFTWRGARHRVRHADGPERIHGEWWRRAAETCAVRDYWAVETEAGRRFWLFRRGDGQDPATGDRSWFLHGFF